MARRRVHPSDNVDPGMDDPADRPPPTPADRPPPPPPETPPPPKTYAEKVREKIEAEFKDIDAKSESPFDRSPSRGARKAGAWMRNKGLPMLGETLGVPATVPYRFGNEMMGGGILGKGVGGLLGALGVTTTYGYLGEKIAEWNELDLENDAWGKAIEKTTPGFGIGRNQDYDPTDPGGLSKEDHKAFVQALTGPDGAIGKFGYDYGALKQRITGGEEFEGYRTGVLEPMMKNMAKADPKILKAAKRDMLSMPPDEYYRLNAQAAMKSQNAQGPQTMTSDGSPKKTAKQGPPFIPYPFTTNKRVDLGNNRSVNVEYQPIAYRTKTNVARFIGIPTNIQDLYNNGMIEEGDLQKVNALVYKPQDLSITE